MTKITLYGPDGAGPSAVFEFGECSGEESNGAQCDCAAELERNAERLVRNMNIELERMLSQARQEIISEQHNCVDGINGARDDAIKAVKKAARKGDE